MPTETLVFTGIRILKERNRPMFKETLAEYDDVLGIVCEGKLTEEDMRQMHALLHNSIAKGGRGLVVDLTGFDGYEGFGALCEDLKMDTAHRYDFDRIAVIGDRKWIEWGSALASALTSAEMRCFDPGATGEAASWARGC